MAIASMELGRFRSERGRKKEIDPVVVNAPRTVMREGPVVLETEKGELRNQWDLFHEYFKKSEFLLVGEFYGERAAGIIDPVVASRQGSTNEKPTGDYWNPRQEFRETALMAANLSLLEQGKLSEEEVLRQYDGMYLAGAKIEDLYKTLGRKLGRIKYGEVERRDAIEKRAKMTTVVESQDSTITEEVRDAHRFIVDSRAQIVQQAAARSESRVDTKKGKRIKIACALGVASILVSSCAPVIVDMNTVTPDVPIVETVSPGGTSTTEAQSPTETRIPTNTVVPTETATPTPEYGIDMEKLHNIPPSIEYLENNFGNGEYIRSPDPISEPEAFDAWFREVLIPALGPVSEREVNYYTDGLSSNDENYTAENDMTATDNQIIGQPEFFYFQSSGVIFPVLVVNVSRFYPDVVDQTFCVALFNDYSGVGMSGTASLEWFQRESANIWGIYLHKRPTFASFPITGQPGSMIESMGGRWWDGENRVNFALGQIAVYDRP